MTETRTATLAEFLLARIAEDEAAARAAKPGPWHWEGDRGVHGSFRLLTSEPAPELPPAGPPYDAEAWKVVYEKSARRTVADGTACDDEGAQVAIDDADAEHIARHHPARVLAECEAKRALIDWHHKIPLPYERDRFLRLLALAYVGHPDYRAEWRP